MARMKKKNKASTAPDGFPEKSWNKLSETWRDAAQAKQTEELEQDIIKAVRNMSNTSFDMNNDDKLKALQEEVKELKSFYTETIAIEKAKVDFCVYLFNTRGVAPSQNTKDAVKSAPKVDNEEDTN
jgi:hypothetical protein